MHPQVNHSKLLVCFRCLIYGYWKIRFFVFWYSWLLSIHTFIFPFCSYRQGRYLLTKGEKHQANRSVIKCYAIPVKKIMKIRFPSFNVFQ